MKIMKKEADYSVRALIFAARAGRPVSASEICSALKAPGPFMRKILQELSRKKILASSKGRGGGFRLLVSPEQITLSRIAEVFSEKKIPGSCHFGERFCRNRSFCALRKRLDEIEKKISDELERTTLGGLMRREL